MKMTTIICHECGTSAEKPTKEINRQRKCGREDFYCSRKCSGKNNTSHLQEWVHSEENKNFIRQYADNGKDEYTGFRETFRRIKKRHRDFDVDLPYLKELWESQNGKCAYTGVDLELPSFNKTNSNYNYMSSIDRIDSSKGYVKGNIQYVSVSVNWLKNKMDDNHVNEFFNIILDTKSKV